IPLDPPPIDPEALLCTPDDLFADPPVVSTLTVSGYGGVDINECRIASDDDPVMVCLENFGVPVPGSCLGHMQEGPSMTVACTPGSWQTVTRVIGLGVEHSDPTVIVDPLDCWTPPPGRP
ncbi:MAG TPA: hypothetical protein VHJ76_06440, partial [Actinomycetota bacterium]|nr:hypothetical protein [Actinomycetota bacterium]